MTPAVEHLDLRRNSLNALRLLLAVLVIVSHAFPISGLAREPHLGDIKLGTLAVGGFFAISGYLISNSRLNTGFVSYSWRRFLRIFPGFWVALIFTGFVAAWIGGLARSGWSPANAASFVVSSAPMFGGRPLDGRTLAGAPLPGSWNGSLWTLRYEVGCYILAGVAVGVAAIWRRRWLTLVAFGVATAATLYVHELGPHQGPAFQTLLLVPYFVAGTLLLRFRDQVRLTAVGAMVAAIAILIASVAGLAEPLAPLPLAYLLLYIGATAPAPFQRVGARNDFSYGMYLYAFPVQQLLVVAGAHHLGLTVFTILSILATVPFAALSWFAIERPAMMAKHLPARWRRGASIAPEPRVEARPTTVRAGRDI